MRLTFHRRRRCSAAASLTLVALCVFCEAARAQDTPIPATSAITGAGCNATDLGDGSDSARNDPVWAPILKNPAGTRPLFPNDVTVLEGRVLGHN